MDIILLLSSISKISFIAFIGITFFLGYEIYLFRKERNKKTTPTLPQFNDAVTTPIGETKIIKEKKKVSLTRADNRLLIFLIILFILFGAITVLGLLDIKRNNTEQAVQQQPQVHVNIVPSKGIHLYDPSFNALVDSAVGTDSSHMSLIIGVETIKEADIDRARIRVNKEVWDISDITTDFDVQKGVYFRSYELASGESKLKIEAQLHSKVDGWLGE